MLRGKGQRQSGKSYWNRKFISCIITITAVKYLNVTVYALVLLTHKTIRIWKERRCTFCFRWRSYITNSVGRGRPLYKRSIVTLKHRHMYRSRLGNQWHRQQHWTSQQMWWGSCAQYIHGGLMLEPVYSISKPPTEVNP